MPKFAQILSLHDISDTALKNYFGEETFSAAEILLKNQAVRDVEYNASDKAVYGIVDHDGTTYNFDFAEDKSSGIRFDGEIENEELLNAAIAAALIIYRASDHYIARYGGATGVQPASKGSVTKGVLAKGEKVGKQKIADVSAKKGVKKSSDSSLKTALLMLASDELVDLLLHYAEKNPDVKRDLAVRFQNNGDAVAKDIIKEIEKVFPKSDSAYSRFTATPLIKQLKSINESIAKLPPKLKAMPIWAIVQGLHKVFLYSQSTSKQLNDIFEASLAELHSLRTSQMLEHNDRHHILRGSFSLIREQVKRYGSADTDLVRTILELCEEIDDYNYIIQQITDIPNRWERNIFKNFLLELYKRSGNTDGKQQMLEKNLQNIRDYEDLIRFWAEEKQNPDKAVKVALEGMKIGFGQYVSLQKVVLDYYVAKKDYETLWAIFKDSITVQPLRGQPTLDSVHSSMTNAVVGTSFTRQSTVKASPMYRTMNVLDHAFFIPLVNNAKETNNYERVKTMLEILFDHSRWSENIYNIAMKYLSPADAEDYRIRMITALEKDIQSLRTVSGYGSFPLDHATPAQTLLATIYRECNKIGELWKIVEKSYELLQEYEGIFSTTKSVEYVMLYQKYVTVLVGYRTNESYRKAAAVMKRIKSIILTIQNEPRKWKEYLGAMKSDYRALRNFQKELEIFDK